MGNLFKGIEPMVYESKISVPYSWWAGDTANKFISAIRDEQKILGTRCANCQKVYVPPRKKCPHCLEEMEWLKVKNEGTLQSYTIIRRKLEALPKDPPVICGLIKLDGADTAMLHYLDEVAEGDIKIGMKVKARFADKKNGTINDISCFIPIT